MCGGRLRDGGGLVSFTVAFQSWVCLRFNVARWYLLVLSRLCVGARGRRILLRLTGGFWSCWLPFLPSLVCVFVCAAVAMPWFLAVYVVWLQV